MVCSRTLFFFFNRLIVINVGRKDQLLGLVVRVSQSMSKPFLTSLKRLGDILHQQIFPYLDEF